MDKQVGDWKNALQSEECPSLETLMAALAEGPLSAEFEKHLAVCPRCEAEAAMYREFERASVDPDQEADVEWIVRRLEEASEIPGAGAESRQPETSAGPLKRLLGWLTGGGWRPLAPVGAALLAAALLLVVWTPGPGEVGDVTDPSITRSSGIQLVTAPLANLSEPPRELTWTAPKDASRFVVRIYEVDRTEFWEGESDTGSIQIPEAIRTKMVVGRRFLWQVVAFGAGGRRLGISEMADFEIRVPPVPQGERNR